ncbi:MAG TPA: hypothetical protein VNV66_03590 [Pilimelia sp.]|nr:hypothetical protein [Pilimelia sp.]
MRIVRWLGGLVAAATVGVVALTGAPAAAGHGGGGIRLHYVATIRVDIGTGPEYFKVRLIHSDDIQAAFASQNYESNQFINGKILRPYPDVNTGYTWRLDPHDLAFVDVSMEVCDGSPTDVENGTLTSDRYCPWASRVVDMQTLWVST